MSKGAICIMYTRVEICLAVEMCRCVYHSVILLSFSVNSLSETSVFRVNGVVLALVMCDILYLVCLYVWPTGNTNQMGHELKKGK